MTKASAALQLPFPLATGCGLKIAVVDSGVNLKHPHICAPTNGVVLWPLDCEISFDDEVGHGTAVMAAIQEKAPEAHYYAVKVFGPSLRATASRMIQAIDWAISQHVDIVNLSLGTANLEHRSSIEAVVKRALAAGTILVCARSEGSTAILPGILEGVVSVEVDWTLPRERYRVAESSESRYFFASGFPRALPGIPPFRNLKGISFAVANMTGFVARACSKTTGRSLTDLCGALSDEAGYRQKG